MNLPAVRFVRAYDVFRNQMCNVWLTLTTQEQLDNPPLAVEIEATGQTVEEVMESLKMYRLKSLTPEVFEEIEKASHRLVPASDSFYGTLAEWKETHNAI